MRIPLIHQNRALSMSPRVHTSPPQQASSCWGSFDSDPFCDVYELSSGGTIQLTCPKNYQDAIYKHLQDECGFRPSTAEWTPYWQRIYQVGGYPDGSFAIESPHIRAMNISTLLCIRGAIHQGKQEFDYERERRGGQAAFNFFFGILGFPVFVVMTALVAGSIGRGGISASKKFSAYLADRRARQAQEVERKMHQDSEARKPEDERLPLWPPQRTRRK